ncbi:hypothetical protein BDV32DRAFT_4999 [Aspergillus pseudonomiae]|nr:hypothetical protein BDV32DRAFT_4999 [Aspergillus pseudonomiae]
MSCDVVSLSHFLKNYSACGWMVFIIDVSFSIVSNCAFMSVLHHFENVTCSPWLYCDCLILIDNYVEPINTAFDYWTTLGYRTGW